MCIGYQEVLSLDVKCANVNQKCEWKGTVCMLEDHLATCGFTLVPCSKECKTENGEVVQLLRKDLTTHLKECPNRDDKCEHCGEEGTYDIITKVHDEICPQKILPCSNSECTREVQRQQLYQHVQSECEYTVVECKHASIGCDTKLKRKDMAAHEEDSKFHLDMAINTVTLLKEHIYMTQKEYMTFEVSGYQEKKTNNTIFDSPPFYTSMNGYHLRLRIYANGYDTAKGTHISVYACFLEGKYNAQLKWPFVGKIIFTLLNQANDNDHYQMVLKIASTDNIKAGSARKNWGFYKYIAQPKLTQKPYLVNDTLYFRMSVKVNDHKPWLECTGRKR